MALVNTIMFLPVSKNTRNFLPDGRPPDTQGGFYSMESIFFKKKPQTLISFISRAYNRKQ
jgi:hypothetical protein